MITQYGKFKKNGRTLVEVLFGIFIFMVIFSNGLSGLKQSSAMYTNQNYLSEVNMALIDIAEQIKKAKFDDVSYDSFGNPAPVHGFFVGY